MDLKEKLRDIGAHGAIPKLIEVDLSIARNDYEVNASGDIIGVWLAPTVTDQITVKFNDTDQPAIPFVQGHVMETPFHRLYLTVASGGTGIVYIVYGASESGQLLRMLVNAQDIPAAMAGMLTTLEDIREELQGPTDDSDGGYAQVGVGLAAVQVVAANADRHGVIVTADPTNANAVYLGFDNTVAANNFFASFASGTYDRVQLTDYRGAIYAIAGGAGNNVGYGEY
jgi:hypothetical protein